MQLMLYNFKSSISVFEFLVADDEADYHNLSKFTETAHIKWHNDYLNWKYQEMFIGQQISILEYFLKDHVTLKTGVTAAENSALPSQE